MKQFVAKLFKEAVKDPKRIVFPEATEPRVLEAVKEITRRKIAHPILVGDEGKIIQGLKNYNISEKKVTFIDPSHYPLYYVKKYIAIRKKHEKKITVKQAIKTLTEPIYFGTMMVQCGEADGLVSGSVHPTSHTLLPAFKIIGTQQRFHKASGVFFMVLDKKLLLFADCSVNVDPDAKDLAGIAIDTAKTTQMMGITPRVAMLSFSTHGSAQHQMVDKVKKATAIVRKKMPGLVVDGEVQVDAALVASVSRLKGSSLAGKANILIFPDLNSGNIAYKLVERLAYANAIGPIIQGLKKPVNDVSRGCSSRDIVEVTAVTVMQAQGKIRY
jgi:phosphate acetyltransferase